MIAEPQFLSFAARHVLSAPSEAALGPHLDFRRNFCPQCSIFPSREASSILFWESAFSHGPQ